MIARLPLVQDRRLGLRGLRLDDRRQQVETRFVRENKGPPLAAGLLLQSRPRLAAPPLDRLLIPLDRSCDGDLRSPSDPFEQPRHLALAGGDAEFLVEDAGDSFASPDIAPEAVGLGPVPEEIRDETKLLRSEFAKGPGAGWERRASDPPPRATASQRLTAPSEASRAVAMSRCFQPC
jgi:hypothetical protein